MHWKYHLYIFEYFGDRKYELLIINGLNYILNI